MKSNYLAPAFLIPFTLFMGAGFAVSQGWVSSTIIIPLILIVLLMLFKMKRHKNYAAHQHCIDIPQGKYDYRINDLQPLTEELRAIAFDLSDTFCIESSPSVVVFAYTHRENGDLFMAYHFGTSVSYDCITEFSDGFSLTTCGTISGGVSPRAPKKFHCVENSSSASQLYARHTRERSFLCSEGLIPEPVTGEKIRDFFVQIMKEYYDHIATIPFLSIKMFFWTLTKRGTRYYKSLAEQIREGTISSIN